MISIASAASGATLTPGDMNASRLSVDSFAMRIMSPDAFDSQPRPFGLGQERPGARQFYQHRNSSRLSVVDVVGERQDFKLQKVDPFFTDSSGDYYREFEQKLANLTAKNSDTDLCIEDFLKESEKEWFKDFRNAKLGRSRSPSRARSPVRSLLVKKNRASRVSLDVTSLAPSDEDLPDDGGHRGPDRDDEFLLGAGYKPPKGLKKLVTSHAPEK
jgi:alpha-1,3-glucan synthase